jgi:hypothetical protein
MSAEYATFLAAFADNGVVEAGLTDTEVASATHPVEGALLTFDVG